MELSGKSVSLCIDGWRSSSNNQFVAITCKYINDEFFSVIKTLSVAEVEDETSATISNLLLKIRNDFNIQEIVAITSDNARNMVKSIRDIGVPNIRCFCHCIQLSLNIDKDEKNSKDENNDIDEVKKVIDRFLQLAKQLRTFNNRNRITVTIPTWTTTRWNSTYNVLLKIKEAKEELIQIYNKINNELNNYIKKQRLGIQAVKPPKDILYDFIPPPDSTDYIILEGLLKILEPLNSITIELQSNEITVGLAYLKLKKVVYEMNKVDNLPKILVSYNNAIKKKLLQKVKDINEDSIIPLLGCILDVRVKVFLNGKLFDDSERNKAVESLTKVYSESKENFQHVEIPVSNDLDVYADVPRKRICLDTDNELERYISYDIFHSTSKSITEVWEYLKPKYPTIYKLAKKYLSVQPTSCEVERVFSLTGRMSNLYKTRLSPEHLEMKIMLSKNY